MSESIWTLEEGCGPVVAIAVHDGHEVRNEVARQMVVDESDRLREEDPHTGEWTSVAPTRIVGTRSRFEVDLNRPRDAAIYRTPEDAWGLQVWNGALPGEMVERSLANFDAFYAELERLYRELADRHGRFLVLDIHSYNHRRDGPDQPPADASGNPQINVGTGTMPDRGRWAHLIDRFVDDLRSFDFPGGGLDVRENVRFRGGACAGWTHRTFPDAACVVTIEVKKFFMDEWTGVVDREVVEAIREALASTVSGLLEELKR
jgi:N-formylglutamate amidohydrolase